MSDRIINTRVLVIVVVLGAVFGLSTFLLIDILDRNQNPDAPMATFTLTELTTPIQDKPTLTRTSTPPAVTVPDIQPTLLATEDTPVVESGPTEQPKPEPGSLFHTVETGENLFRISLRYGVPIENILVANAHADPRSLHDGQVLVIPTSEPQAGPTAPIAQAPVAGTPTPTNTPTPAPPTAVNGVSIDSIVVMSPEVIENARQIFARGQELGLNPRAFSKVGDSTIENPHFVARFDEGTYDLADYVYLQRVIDHFAGSFGRQGMAVKRGFHSWTVTDPMWADKDNCLPNETPVACEIRINRPAILLIRLGSNDAGVPGSFDYNLRQVVEYAIEQGVIPVIGTKADRFEGDGNVNNDILRQIAVDYALPLWDFDLVSATIPNRGLYPNDVHLTIFYANDYSQPRALQTGHGVHNLTALMMLEAILRDVIEPASE